MVPYYIFITIPLFPYFVVISLIYDNEDNGSYTINILLFFIYNILSLFSEEKLDIVWKDKEYLKIEDDRYRNILLDIQELFMKSLFRKVFKPRNIVYNLNCMLNLF